jgi:hypothetical protein
MTDTKITDLIVTEIVPTHPRGFGGHVFEYESNTDLFRCVNNGCGQYEIVVRDSATGAIEPCRATATVGAECRCVYSCADDPPTACHLSGDWHTHPDEDGGFGPCPAHPDAPGDR